MPCDEAFKVEALADDSLVARTLNYGVGWSGSYLWSCAAVVDTLRMGALGVREGSRDGDGQRGAPEFRQEAVRSSLAALRLITLRLACEEHRERGFSKRIDTRAADRTLAQGDAT